MLFRSGMILVKWALVAKLEELKRDRLKEKSNKAALSPIVLAQDMDQEKFADVLNALKRFSDNNELKIYSSDVWEHRNAYDFFYYLVRQKSIASDEQQTDLINTLLKGFPTTKNFKILERQFRNDISRINELWDRLNIFQNDKFSVLNLFSGNESAAMNFLGFIKNIMGEVKDVKVRLHHSKQGNFTVRLELKSKASRMMEVRSTRILVMKSVLQTIARSLTALYTELQPATPLGVMSPQVFVTYVERRKIVPGDRIDLIVEGEKTILGAIFNGVQGKEVNYTLLFSTDGNATSNLLLAKIRQVSRNIQTLSAVDQAGVIRPVKKTRVLLTRMLMMFVMLGFSACQRAPEPSGSLSVQRDMHIDEDPDWIKLFNAPLIRFKNVTFALEKDGNVVELTLDKYRMNRRKQGEAGLFVDKISFVGTKSVNG